MAIKLFLRKGAYLDFKTKDRLMLLLCAVESKSVEII